MEKSSTRLLSFITHFFSLIPAVLILVLAFSGKYAANPIQWATQRTGDVALILLLLTLTLRPLGKLSVWKSMPVVRRIIGWYVVKYGLAHLLLLAGIDYRFQFRLLWIDLSNKTYIWIGLIVLILLFAVGFATLKKMEGRTAGVRKVLAWMIYPAGLLAVLHFFLARKSNLLSFQGDVLLPLISFVIFTLLMLLRIPFIEKLITKKTQVEN